MASPSPPDGNLGGAVAVLRRNPSYHGRRPHRLAAIVYREQPQTGQAVGSIEAGNADMSPSPTRPSPPEPRSHAASASRPRDGPAAAAALDAGVPLRDVQEAASHADPGPP